MVFEILKDSTDTLAVYPPRQYLGNPSSVTVRVSTPSTALPTSGDAATVDSVSTTLGAAADRDADTVTLTSGTGVTAGRKYLIDDGGRLTVVEALGEASDVVTLADPLPRDVANGASFFGLHMSHALTAAETDTAGPGLAKWTATLGGVARTWDQTFRVVTEIFRLPVFGPDLVKRKEVRRLKQSTDETLTELESAAWEQVIRPRLRARGFLEERINTPEELVPPLIEGAILLLKQASDRPFEEINDQETRVDRALSRALASSRHWYDDDDGDVVIDERDQPELGRRVVGWSR